jgi:hypothetical protein
LLYLVAIIVTHEEELLLLVAIFVIHEEMEFLSLVATTVIQE